jgi:hypothetical protein
MFDRRAILLTAVSCLAAGHALRALIGVAHSEPDVGQDPEGDVEEEAVDPIPVRDVSGPAAARDDHGFVRHQDSLGLPIGESP